MDIVLPSVILSSSDSLAKRSWCSVELAKNGVGIFYSIFTISPLLVGFLNWFIELYKSRKRWKCRWIASSAFKTCALASSKTQHRCSEMSATAYWASHLTFYTYFHYIDVFLIPETPSIYFGQWLRVCHMDF